ncbi:GNA1162 family protein [Acinetobacter nosocomialis]|uniref:DUF799 domain-containing protein n=1 Tax=Acinetobacter nosocomialis TaxID=106654 RepID=UPI0011210885|nr:GNA1162 family protein [Acinetobacter nosocomialis]MDE1704876.1 DUF799 family lipoprotein [Acinetobacter nosocomialis]HDG7213389.1 DUF799 family lipoprotein [Acinetobacter nosocomialis]
MIKKFLIAGLVISSITFTGCAVTPAPNKDITAYKAHMPKSILVLPPVNDSPDVKATYSYWPTVIAPVAEAGYYVFPISVVDNMFKENGVTNGSDAQSIAPQKLQEIFGADAALYIRIKEYGSKYQVIQSVATVSADAKLVDLKTGDVIWTGEKKLSQSSSDNNSGLLGAVVGALVEQISSNFNDRAYPIASMVNAQLFTPTPYSPATGLLYGPRSPQYQQDGIAK